MSPADPPRDLAERILRETLADPENLRTFPYRAVPENAPGFDFGRARLLERE